MRRGGAARGRRGPLAGVRHGSEDSRLTAHRPSLIVIDELLPEAFHNTEQYANNRIECDHGRVKARLRVAAAFDELVDKI